MPDINSVIDPNRPIYQQLFDGKTHRDFLGLLNDLNCTCGGGDIGDIDIENPDELRRLLSELTGRIELMEEFSQSIQFISDNEIDAIINN